MKTFWSWLVTSSADPAKWSLTIKGFAGTAITIITMVAGLANIQVGDLTPVVDAVVSFVQAILLAVSSVAFIIGFVRKVWNTVSNKNPEV